MATFEKSLVTPVFSPRRVIFSF